MPRIAIVTGAASGIGLALSRRLAGRGDTVVLADIDGAAAKDAAAALPGAATAAELDVRDADAVAALVHETADRHGRLDLLVNNAGIGIGGEAYELTLDHWRRAVEVNLMGVVHGVAAAYPLMVTQGDGHIVNTASLAGLAPSPLLTPYSTTKHAVVGLSRSLRAEGAAHGVKVTVVCPGFTDTPILDKGGPDDLPRAHLADETRTLAVSYQRRLYDADRLAADIIRGIDRNRAMVVAPASARLAYLTMRLAPGAVERFNAAILRRFRQRPGAATPADIPGRDRADG